MFAVIILGIGFILVAAMFPVMISQSKITVEETSSAALARSALALTSRIAEGGDIQPAGMTNWGPLLPPSDLLVSPPATTAAQTAAVALGSYNVSAGQQVVSPGKVLAFNDDRLANLIIAPTGPGTVDYRNNLWNAIKGSIVPPSDPRFAWVPLYRRDCTYYNATSGNLAFPSGAAGFVKSDAPFATVYFIPVSVRNRPIYDASAGADTDLASSSGLVVNLSPRPVEVRILPERASVSGYAIAFYNPSITTFPSFAGQDLINSVAEGTYVVISDDRISLPATDRGRMNGRIFRVGNRRVDLDGPKYDSQPVWELAPGSEFSKDPGANGLLWNFTTNNADADDIVALGNDVACTNGLKAAGLIPNTQNVAVTANGVHAIAYIVGRNPANGAFEGPTQDVGVYVTFVKVN